MKALHLSRLAALTAAAALPIALAAPASAATAVTFDCQANAPIVGPQQVVDATLVSGPVAAGTEESVGLIAPQIIAAIRTS